MGGDPARQGFQIVTQMSVANECERFQEPDKRFMTDCKGDAALAFIEENRNRPFFLYFSTNSVHFP